MQGQDGPRGSLMSHRVGAGVVTQHGMDVGPGKWEKGGKKSGKTFLSLRITPADSFLSPPGTDRNHISL